MQRLYYCMQRLYLSYAIEIIILQAAPSEVEGLINKYISYQKSFCLAGN